MSYYLYKVIHLTGVAMVLLSLGALLVVHAEGAGKRSPWRKLAAATNGIGLLLVFMAGFALIARLSLDWPWPWVYMKMFIWVWVYMKMFIWVIFGFLTAAVARVPQHASLLWWGVLLLTAMAAYLAGFKPF